MLYGDSPINLALKISKMVSSDLLMYLNLGNVCTFTGYSSIFYHSRSWIY